MKHISTNNMISDLHLAPSYSGALLFPGLNYVFIYKMCAGFLLDFSFAIICLFFVFFFSKEAAFRKVVQATMVRDRQHGPVVELNRIQVTSAEVLIHSLYVWTALVKALSLFQLYGI